MTVWLDPVRTALDAVPDPVVWYFRDDDAGWAEGRLTSLLDLFAVHHAPIDLAVIPIALSDGLVQQLRHRIEMEGQPIGLHQHGYAHRNHETEGRKCEFGPQRSLRQQYQDIEAGRNLLQSAFGSNLQPTFTPPWNRCTQTTVDVLQQLGFKALSRDSGASSLESGQLTDIPVHVDWFGKFRLDRAGFSLLGGRIAAVIGQSPAVGVMLHHERMDTGELGRLAELLGLLTQHRSVRLVLMQKWLP